MSKKFKYFKDSINFIKYYFDLKMLLLDIINITSYYEFCFLMNSIFMSIKMLANLCMIINFNFIFYITMIEYYNN